jgi:GNAT superfamily N-acetyltransferase
MAMSGRVRLAVPGDASAIARVHVESWRAAYIGLMPAAVLDAFTVEAREPRWQAILTREAPDERTLVVLAPGGPVAGFASTGPSRDEGAAPDVAELYALYLAPGSWGAGLGRALFAAAIEDLRERGRAAMTLWVLDGNARGRRFYEAAGMRADGAIKIEIEERAELPHVRYRLPLGRDVIPRAPTAT